MCSRFSVVSSPSRKVYSCVRASSQLDRSRSSTCDWLLDVVTAVRSAASGNAPIDPRVARALLPSPSQRRDDVLSAREEQVLRLLAQGMANKQIGRALGISERTVKVHVGNVFRRLGVADRTSAALWARDHLPAERP